MFSSNLWQYLEIPDALKLTHTYIRSKLYSHPFMSFWVSVFSFNLLVGKKTTATTTVKHSVPEVFSSATDCLGTAVPFCTAAPVTACMSRMLHRPHNNTGTDNSEAVKTSPLSLPSRVGCCMRVLDRSDGSRWNALPRYTTRTARTAAAPYRWSQPESSRGHRDVLAHESPAVFVFFLIFLARSPASWPCMHSSATFAPSLSSQTCDFCWLEGKIRMSSRKIDC